MKDWAARARDRACAPPHARSGPTASVLVPAVRTPSRDRFAGDGCARRKGSTRDATPMPRGGCPLRCLATRWQKRRPSSISRRSQGRARGAGTSFRRCRQRREAAEPAASGEENRRPDMATDDGAQYRRLSKHVPTQIPAAGGRGCRGVRYSSFCVPPNPLGTLGDCWNVSEPQGRPPAARAGVARGCSDSRGT